MPCRRTLQSGSRSSLAEALTATIAEATIGGMVTPPASNTQPLTDADLAALTALLDSLPQTLEPLDIVMLDGYLCGVLLQPRPVDEARWLAHVVDLDGRAPPTRFDMATLRELVLRRYAELNRAIHLRQWFDPWVYELDEEAGPSETVMPWVAGFASAVDLFPQLMDKFEDQLVEPLAGMYRHLDPDDLEDADALLAVIETLEPPAELSEAVEDLVQGVLLIADVSRPRTPAQRPASRPGPRRR